MNARKFYAKMTVAVTRDVIEHEKTAHGPLIPYWRSVPDGTITGELIVTVDVDGIVATLGARALRNKSQRASGVNGLVTVTVDKKTLVRVRP